jgi:hypothetical protein
MIGAVEALGKFIKGSGVGLPHGTVAWVIHDGGRYIREWHPMAPDPAGKPLGNWWPLSNDLERGGIDGRFSEYEVTHYSVIEVPPMPGEVPKKKQSETGPVEFQAIVGKDMQNGKHTAFTVLADLRSGEPKVVTVSEDTEEEALRMLQLRADAVLRTFFHSYRTVRI